MSKSNILRNKILFLILFVIIFQNSFLTISLVNGLSTIIGLNQELHALSDNTTNTIFVPSHPALAIDSNQNLFLTYRENYQDYSSIVMLRTNEGDEYNVWNLTRNYLYQPNDTDLITSYPAMVFHQDKFYLGITSRNNSISILKILEIDPTNLVTTTLLKLNSTESYYFNPKIGVYNQSLWFSCLIILKQTTICTIQSIIKQQLVFLAQYNYQIIPLEIAKTVNYFLIIMEAVILFGLKV